MKKLRFALLASLLPTLVLLAACGGGGGGGGSAGAPNRSAVPTPTPVPGAAYQGRYVIGFGAGRALESVPLGKQAVLPPGASDGGPVAGAIVIYPDGSKQIADANGVFYPFTSSYGQKNQTVLRANPQAQPNVILADPKAVAAPSTATVQAYATSASLIRFRGTASANPSLAGLRPGIAGASRGSNLAGLVLLPQQASMLSPGLLNLDVEGIDSNNAIVDLSAANITWSANSGTVLPFAGEQAAYYVPPALASGAMTDTISVAANLPDSPKNIYYASVSVNVIASASAATVAGTISNSNGPIPKGLAVYVQPGPSQLFGPTLWLAQADANGGYQLQLPASARFSMAIGAPDAYSPTGSYETFVAASASGATTYTSGAPGSTDNVALAIAPGNVPLTFVSSYDNGSVPSYVPLVRNAWYSTYGVALRRIFEADSGVQPLLAAPPQGAITTPAAAHPVNSGVLSSWCYQWQTLNGTNTLIVAENTDAQCSAPGNEAFAIVPTGGGSFSYLRFASNTPYDLSGSIDVVSSSLLVESGSWSQTLTTNGSQITNDSANVTAALYDIDNQTLGSPVYNETLSYSYTVDASGAHTAQFSNDVRTSAFDGAMISNETLTKTSAAAIGSAQCASGTSATCFSITGSFNVADGNGGFNTYAVSDTFALDGSGTLQLRSTKSGDASSVTLPIAADRYQNANNCIVCSTSPGSIIGTDGVTALGTVTVTNARLTKVLIYDTPVGSSTHGPNVVDELGFIL